MGNYSNDQDLRVYEPNILEFLPDAKPGDFEGHHAKAKLVVDQALLFDEQDLKTASIYYALFSLFMSLSQRENDIFYIKAMKYLALFKEKVTELLEWKLGQ